LKKTTSDPNQRTLTKMKSQMKPQITPIKVANEFLVQDPNSKSIQHVDNNKDMLDSNLEPKENFFSDSALLNDDLLNH
jgi:hypothetical protein